MIRAVRFVSLSAALVCAPHVLPAAPARSAVQWLSVCDGCPSNPFGITESGVISGTVATANGERGFLMKSGGPVTYVDTPGGQFIGLVRGNNSGEYAGAYFSFTDFTVHAFVRESDGTLTDIVRPNTAITAAQDVAENGTVLGSYTNDFTTATGWVSYLYSKGAFTETFVYPDPNANGTIALGLNARGAIVGVFTLEGSPTLHAFERTANGGYLEIAFPAASETYLSDINNQGTAVGYWRDLSGGYHGLVYRDGLCYTLDPGTSPSGYSNATLTGIDSQGDVVGVSFAQTLGDGDGFLISGGANTAMRSDNGVACTVSNSLAARGR